MRGCATVCGACQLKPRCRSFLQPDSQYFLQELQHHMAGKYARLNEAVAALVRAHKS